ncbi:MAG: phospholipase D-like domain-containing protein [Bdellovibrionales bacterium]|nr:phospholipase D-like domain-containing protein [Bdellovibrionales bacterium]
MNFFYLIFLLNIYSTNALEHKILFTNPLCNTPDRAITYCTKSDYNYNIIKSDGVFQTYVKSLFSAPYTKVIVSYLSFSNTELTEAYKKLILKNNPDFTIILDDPFEDEPDQVRKLLRQPLTYKSFHEEPTSEYLSFKNGSPIRALSEAYEILKFAHDNNTSPSPRLLLRGQTDGSGYSHMKMTYLEADNDKSLILGSANLSQGLALHHENWHFFKDTQDSNFVEVHKCILDNLIDEPLSYDKSKYARHTTSCTNQQNDAQYKTYFTPGQGQKALVDIKKGFEESDEIWIAAHRFSNTQIFTAIKKALSENKTVRLLVDDDLYWVEHKRGRYLNSKYEVKKVKPLIKLGLKIKYLSTNNKEFLLHHNKYIIFMKNHRPFKVFTGAGNLTISAFTRNFENYFMTNKAEVSSIFANQYKIMWKLAFEANELTSISE